MILKKSGQVESLSSELVYTHNVLIESWKTLYDNNLLDDDVIWAFVQQARDFYWYGNSILLNVKTTIKPYTNKKGHTHMAHFTQNGKYIKPAKVNDVPIEYTGYFHINEYEFDIDHTYFDISPKPLFYNITHLFKPKEMLRTLPRRNRIVDE